jgi:PAS domain S-box-containing protein
LKIDPSQSPEFPDTERKDFMVLETMEQRESLYDPIRQEILRVLNQGKESITSEVKKTERTLEDGTVIIEEITKQKPSRQYWMSVQEILPRIKENNPKLKITIYKCYYHLHKLCEQGLVEQYPPPKESDKGTDKRVRGMHFRTTAKFFVPTTFEISTDLVGKDILSDEINERAVELAQKVKQTGTTDAFEYALEINGDSYWFSVTMSLHDDGESIVSVVRDITDQKKAQEALRRSQERLDLALKGADLAPWDWHHKTSTLIFSKRYAEMLGYSLDEINKFANDWESMIHPDDLEDVLERWDNHLEGKTPLYSSEHRVLNNDGEYIWVLDRGRIVEWDEEGNPHRAAGTIRDITREKLMEEALGKSEERYLRLVNESLQGIAIFQDGRVVFANPAYARTVGYSIGELLEMSADDTWKLVHPEDRAELERRNQEVKNGAKTLPRHRFRYIRPDGDIRWVESYVNVIQHEGRPAMQSLEVDITEQWKAEEAVREERDKAQMYLDMAGSIFLALDTDGKITLLNRRGCEIFGYESEEAIGKSWFDQVPENVRDEVRSAFKELMTEEITHIRYRERPILTKSGEERIIAWHTNVLKDDEGNVTGLISSGTDVTDEKRVMQLLSESEAKFRGVFEKSPIGILLINSQGIIEQINSAACEILGISCPEDYQNYRLQDDPNLPDWVLKNIKEGVSISFEVPYYLERAGLITSKSGPIYLEITGIALNISEDGTVTTYLAQIQDITERKRVEQEIVDSERKYRTLVESSTQPIGIIQGKPPAIVYANPATTEVAGYSEEELISLGPEWVSKVMRPRSAVGTIETLQDIFQGKLEPNPRGYEDEYVHKDGSFLWLRAHPSKITYRDEPALQILFINLTKQMQLEQALAESEEQYRLLFESASDAILLMKDYTITDCNTAAAQMFECEKEELLGKTPWQLSPRYQPDKKSSKERTLMYIDAVLSGKPQLFRWNHKKCDGTKFTVEVGLNKINLGDKIVVQAVLHLIGD